MKLNKQEFKTLVMLCAANIEMVRGRTRLVE